MGVEIILWLAIIAAVGGNCGLAIFRDILKQRVENSKIASSQELVDLRAKVEALSAQVAETSKRATEFDLSFDQALTRTEKRVRILELQNATAPIVAQSADADANVRVQNVVRQI